VHGREIGSSAGGRVFSAVNAALLFLFSLSILYPFWSLILQSFSSVEEVSAMGLHVWIRHWTTASWRFIFSDERLGTGYANTLFRVAFGTLTTLLVTFTAAYALSKRDLPGRAFLTIAFVLTMFFSGGLIPSYLLIRRLGLMNSRWVLIIPAALNVYYIIVTRNFLMTIDQAMEDSAIIDGAGYWTVLLRIIAPLSRPVLATIGLWTAVAHWNSWFDALIYVDDPKKQVLQLLIRELMKTLTLGELDSAGANLGLTVFVPPQSVVAVTILATIGPIVLVYPFIQKHFVKGVMLGSVKG